MFTLPEANVFSLCLGGKKFKKNIPENLIFLEIISNSTVDTYLLALWCLINVSKRKFFSSSYLDAKDPF